MQTSHKANIKLLLQIYRRERIPENFTVDDPAIWRRTIAKLLAGDALNQAFEREQSFGDLLSRFMPSIYNDSLIYGFSGHSAEECHEFRHGPSTCQSYRMREGKCIGKKVKAFVPWEKINVICVLRNYCW